MQIKAFLESLVQQILFSVLLSTKKVLKFHILKDDFDARGLKTEKEFRFVSYDQMVELCTRSTPIVSWNA